MFRKTWTEGKDTYVLQESSLEEILGWGLEDKSNKKFWEELIVYFPLIRRGPDRKRRLQQFFVAGGIFYQAVAEQR
jgi:hypothetical protein